MLKLSKLLSAVCVLALTACSAPQPIPYTKPPRPVLDPLPPNLQLTERDYQLCRRLLLIFSASPETLQASCRDISK